MGEIIDSRHEGNCVVMRVLVDEGEALQLEGHRKKVHVFAASLGTSLAKLLSRGRNEGTKFFTVPLPLRFRNKRLCSQPICQKLETPLSIHYVYIVDK